VREPRSVQLTPNSRNLRASSRPTVTRMGQGHRGPDEVLLERNVRRVPGKAKRYTPEFKARASKMVVEKSLPVAQVARELCVSDTTLRFWVQDYQRKLAGPPLPQDIPNQERIRELERRNRELEIENAFLREMAAYVHAWAVAIWSSRYGLLASIT
jgi:transposase